jgi:hypothetical protein
MPTIAFRAGSRSDVAEKCQADDLKVIRSDEPLAEIVELFPNRLGC